MLASQVFSELGKNMQMFGSKVLVRTDPVPEKIGSIYVPAKLSTFYGKLQGEFTFVNATVLTVGPEAELKEGDKIMFKRIHFANLYKLQDNTLVGFIEENNIEALLEE